MCVPCTVERDAVMEEAVIWNVILRVVLISSARRDGSLCCLSMYVLICECAGGCVKSYHTADDNRRGSTSLQQNSMSSITLRSMCLRVCVGVRVRVLCVYFFLCDETPAFLGGEWRCACERKLNEVRIS